ncbi:major facilitator superfamily domain-containing protein [Trichophaea hybrida]|nr:major facilitator superfamily domain-containing protein [Trichophaea hybrida]
MASGSTTTTVTIPTPTAAIELSTLKTSTPSISTPSFRRRNSDEEQTTHDEPPEGATVFTRPDVSTVKLQLVAMNFATFLAGVNDASTGVLVPYLQPAYNIGLLFVALVYLFNFAGWTVAAFTNVHLTARIGTGGVMLLGSILQMLAHALQLWKPPFPLFVITYFLAGVGIAYQDAQANSFVGGVNDAHRWLGVLHALYGAGALVSPLIVTNIASRTPYWNYFYFILLGIAAVNVGIIAWVFRKGMGRGATGAKETANKDFKRSVTNKTVLIMSAFFFLYVGAEVTAGGWVVEFLIRVRGGKAGQVGYVASGFWGGLTLGRILLADITFRLGERRMIFVYLLIALAVQLVFWFVPSIIANAVMISFLGFFIGPFFPTGISVATKLLPRELHVAAIGFMATTGQAGSAAFPFLTGAVAAKVGVQVLQPILVSLLVGMAILWTCIPRVDRRNV